jgi:hypothetical protein
VDPGVALGKGLFVGNAVDVWGTGVAAGAHPLTMMLSATNPMKKDLIDIFMTLSPFTLITQVPALQDLSINIDGLTV